MAESVTGYSSPWLPSRQRLGVTVKLALLGGLEIRSKTSPALTGGCHGTCQEPEDE